ncbi:hypothetical protein JKF63_06771 [Porcisia hertigi]|uniref:Uncharacterized protein n=1 Tax=Porcisia hertigi TaxID=2761500 RepID=A0A836IDQ7_9TRYP|nr:hypothetical protein JKF63_06771 [Porcisia hertigi]
MSQEEETARFDFNEGAGTALGSLPCFTAVSTRGAAGKALEAALEPLHRIVYGRAGNNGKRRAALERFKGCPASMEAEVSEKISKLTKDRLRDVIRALGINVHISLPHAQVAAGVVKFLMAPRDDGKIKGSLPAAPKTKKEYSAKRSASPDTDGKPLMKKVRAETPTPSSAAPPSAVKSPPSSPAPAASAGPSDEAVLVEVYRHVLSMTPEDRAVLGVKALRTNLEAHFKLVAGGLRHKKDIITSAASDCVRALKEAEMRAAAAALQNLDGAPSPVSNAGAEQATISVASGPCSPDRTVPSPDASPLL